MIESLELQKKKEEENIEEKEPVTMSKKEKAKLMVNSLVPNFEKVINLNPPNYPLKKIGQIVWDIYATTKYKINNLKEILETYTDLLTEKFEFNKKKWTSPGLYTPLLNLVKHFVKHKKEFGEISLYDYYNIANEAVEGGGYLNMKRFFYLIPSIITNLFTIKTEIYS